MPELVSQVLLATVPQVPSVVKRGAKRAARRETNVEEPPRPDGRTTRWAGHRTARREEFVLAAIRVIERVGPSARVSQITAEMGVGRSALYRQFTDRADLDRAIADWATEALVTHVSAHLRLGSDLDASIEEAVGAYLDYLLAHPMLFRFVQQQAAVSEATAGGPNPVQRVKDTVAGRVAAIARDYLTSVVDSPPETAELFAFGVIGMVDAITSHWLEDPTRYDRARVTATLVALIRGAGVGLAGPFDPTRVTGG